MLPWLTPSPVSFPSIHQALDEPDGLLAAGGDLTPEWLLCAYRSGIFPWFNPGEPILWWSPNPRMVLKPSEIIIRRSLAKRIRNAGFTVTFDLAFEAVIEACSGARRTQDGTWITREIKAAYCEMHKLGYAHSVEVWAEESLVGGLYGISLGKLFFGESMFSHQADASKVALVALARHLEAHQFALIDCQMHTAHLASLGAKDIARAEFVDYLTNYVDCSNAESLWQQEVR